MTRATEYRVPVQITQTIRELTRGPTTGGHEGAAAAVGEALHTLRVLPPAVTREFYGEANGRPAPAHDGACGGASVEPAALQQARLGLRAPKL